MIEGAGATIVAWIGRITGHTDPLNALIVERANIPIVTGKKVNVDLMDTPSGSITTIVGAGISVVTRKVLKTWRACTANAPFIECAHTAVIAVRQVRCRSAADPFHATIVRAHIAVIARKRRRTGLTDSV